ncbi:MAG TPA: hypothetical protein VKD72_11960 [Gemmataceae bacterium]|nr:hypothetical protein [Gemmataceae bacterium]
MPYSIEDVDGCFRSYLAGREDLTREERVRLYSFLDVLREHGDNYRNDPGRRCGPGSANFIVRFLLMGSGGKVRAFDLVVNDAGATYGVLRIVYVDEVGR